MNSIQQIQKSFNQFLAQHFLVTQEQITLAGLTLNTDIQKQQFGDLNSNAPLILAKQLKKNPALLADEIVTNFKHPDVASITKAGAGFINITLQESTWHKIAHDLFTEQEQFFKPDATFNKHSYCIEFVSANPTGPLHFGHGRSGIIGDVLGNILTFLGHSVSKEFYINDAGNQIAKLGASLRIRCQQELGLEAQMPEDGYHGAYLIDLAQECIAQHGNSVLAQPDTFFQNYAKDILLDRIKETLLNYGIAFDTWFSEKQLHENGSIDTAVELLTKHGHVFEAEGALWFKSTDFGDDKDRVIRKSTGEWTYIAADIAYLLNKITRGFTHLVMVLGHDHHSYAIRLEAIRKALGQERTSLETILYQLVRMKNEGELVRLSKRAGNIITLQDVIDSVGTDVARFFYLHRKADAHLEFDLALAKKKSDENPVYYVQYAFVRIHSLIKKAELDPVFSTITAQDAAALTSKEFLLLKKIVSLKDLLEQIGANQHTHLLSYYLVELADLYHSYYAAQRVIELEHVPQTRARLLLMGILKQTFATCLNLLGISAPTSM